MTTIGYISLFHLSLFRRQSWYRELLPFVVDGPVKLPLSPDLLTQAGTGHQHHNPEGLHLHGWLLRKPTCKGKAFHRKP